MSIKLQNRFFYVENLKHFIMAAYENIKYSDLM